MGEMYEMRRECLRKEAHRPEVLAVLTDKEYEMVLLINQHQTNREIAEKMFLSEGRGYQNKEKAAVTAVGREFLTIGE